MSAMRCVQTGNERILQPGDIPDYSGKIRDRIPDLQAERIASTWIRSGVHWGRSFLTDDFEASVSGRRELE